MSPSQCHSCLYLCVIVSMRLGSWSAPRCSESANYLVDLTPNKSSLSWAYVKQAAAHCRSSQMKHCMCHTECVSLCGLFSSLEHYFSLFEVSFILPTYPLQNWLGLSRKHPWCSVGFTWTLEASSFLAWAAKDIARLDIITISKLPQRNTRGNTV